MSFNDFFARNAGGGGGAPAFKFDQDGSGVVGEITDLFETFVTVKGTTEPKLNKNNEKQPQLIITIQTALRNWQGLAKVPVDKETDQPKPPSDDDGKRRIYCKYQMIRAVGEALTKAGVDLNTGLQVGGQLGVRKIGEQDLGGGNSMFEYEAAYTPPVQAAGGDAFAAAAEAAPAAAPVPAAAPPAPAPAPAPTGGPWDAQSAPAAPAAASPAAWPAGDEPPF